MSQALDHDLTCHTDPEKFVQQQHRFGRDKIFFIKLIQEVNTIEVTDTIEVTVVNSTDITNDEDIIKLYLEGPSSGGNKEKEVKFIKNVDEGVYRVQLSSIEGNVKFIIPRSVLQLIVMYACLAHKLMYTL